MRARSGDWSRRTPEIQQSASSSARSSGSTLRRKQQRSGSVAHRPVDPLAAVGLDGDPVALLDRAPGGVGLLEQRAGVEREDARAGRVPAHQVDEHGGLLLPRRGEREPVLAEPVDRFEQDLFRARSVIDCERYQLRSGFRLINPERIRPWYLVPAWSLRPRTGRKGSLDNPEVREDVPGHVIPILEREFDDFDNEAEKFLAGDTPENEFIGFRLKQGVYGQRQADVQMIRVKLPVRRRHAGADGRVRRRRSSSGRR